MTKKKNPEDLLKVGRHPFFETPEELQAAIDKYFNGGLKIKDIIVGKGANKQVIKVPVPTITGLCIFLGFESRQSFYAYEQKPEFCYTIKKARLFIEREYEEQLQIGNTIGAIFALKNMGWFDKQEIDHTTKGESINREYTIEELKERVRLKRELNKDA